MVKFFIRVVKYIRINNVVCKILSFYILENFIIGNLVIVVELDIFV